MTVESKEEISLLSVAFLIISIITGVPSHPPHPLQKPLEVQTAIKFKLISKGIRQWNVKATSVHLENKKGVIRMLHCKHFCISIVLFL